MFDSAPHVALNESKIVPLFNHPNFSSILYPEDDIIKLTPANRYEVYAQRVVLLWESLSLRRPLKKNREAAVGAAISDLIALMKGQHPRLPHKKLSVEQIMTSVKNWDLAVHDPNYLPIDKKAFKALNIPQFIYSRFLDHSYILEYLNPPKPLQKELNPRLTKLLMRYFSEAKWGESINNVDLVNHIHFIRASNRIISYLNEHKDQLQPLMKLSPQNPDRAAYGLIQVAKNSGNWNNYDLKWLANNISMGKLDIWLRNQGFFKNSRTV